MSPHHPSRRARSLSLAISCVFALAVAGCQTVPAGAVRTASATLFDASGREVGKLRFTDLGAVGVLVTGEIRDLPAGQHGIHIHGVGQCDAPAAFASAGSHFNPGARKHGLANPDGSHAGDLPNLVIGTDLRGTYRATSSTSTLGSDARSLLDEDGSAVVVHAAADDQQTDPAGNSGARVACGVIRGE